MLASCVSLEEIVDEYQLYGEWYGVTEFQKNSKTEYLLKTAIFSKDCKECTVYTSISMLNGFDEEKLVVRLIGSNRLILTEEGSYKALYKIKLTKGHIGSFEMTWNNHTRLEKQHVPDKSLSARMDIPKCL